MWVRFGFWKGRILYQRLFGNIPSTDLRQRTWLDAYFILYPCQNIIPCNPLKQNHRKSTNLILKQDQKTEINWLHRRSRKKGTLYECGWKVQFTLEEEKAEKNLLSLRPKTPEILTLSDLSLWNPTPIKKPNKNKNPFKFSFLICIF